jgi:hypothetical protein
MKHCKHKNMIKAYSEYMKSNNRHLWDVYGHYSQYKERAFNYCRELAYIHKSPYVGFGELKIISHNSQVFTIGFLGEINDRLAFFYITPSYDRYIYIDEIDD